MISVPPTDSYPLDEPAPVPARDIARDWRRERPDVPVHSIPLVTPLWRIAKLLADDRRRVLAGAGVDGATLDLLSTLRRSGTPHTLTTRELAARSLVTAGAISQRVARAEKDGLVTRTRSAGRDRSVRVTLTESGHRLVDAVVATLLRREAELVDGLDPDTRDRLADILDDWLTDLTRRLG